MIWQITSCQQISPADFKITYGTDDHTIADKTSYLNTFEKIQHALNFEGYDKLILSRIKSIACQRQPTALFEKINATYITTYNYLLSSEATGTWLGASPELLLNSEMNTIHTVSLAGTRPSGITNMAWHEKEREEQAFVTDYILQTLDDLAVQEITTNGPFTAVAGPVEHLKTEIKGQIKSTDHLLTLLEKLHPTPAVCGIPKMASLNKILSVEPHKRKLYTGFIGLVNERQSTFFVNLRCMELQKERALLFVGGGITQKSEAEKEWNETEKKSETLQRVLDTF